MLGVASLLRVDYREKRPDRRSSKFSDDEPLDCSKNRDDGMGPEMTSWQPFTP
jgi:hypothetical protein